MTTLTDQLAAALRAFRDASAWIEDDEDIDAAKSAADEALAAYDAQRAQQAAAPAAIDVLAVLDNIVSAARARADANPGNSHLHAAWQDAEQLREAVAELIEREKVMREALEEIARRPNHSMLEECAYVGAPTKKWMGARKHYSAGHTDSTREARAIATAALARAARARCGGAA